MDSSKLKSIADSFKIRASATLDIMGKVGLSEKQQEEYDTLVKRNLDFANGVDKVKPLTDIMTAKLLAYQHTIDNPELPDGAKTYCKAWLKEKLYNRRPEIKSKYIQKGNTQEEDGFTLMAVQLNLGMVYKNTETLQNDYIIGTDDLFVNKVVYDNKCAWSLDTFPMFETEIPSPKYEDQINSYCDLRKCQNGVLAYTLVNADLDNIERAIKWVTNDNERYKIVANMVFTKTEFEQLKAEYFPLSDYNWFVEIPERERIVTFEVKYNPERIKQVYERVIMCRKYIFELLTNKYKN